MSLLVYGLPSIMEIVAPLQISLVKTPEFYLFIVFYVIIAPTTLIFWGSGITIIFSLLYAISAFYEVKKISEKETERIALGLDKVYHGTKVKDGKSNSPTLIL